MSKRILFNQGHPDASQPHLCHALATSYSRRSQSAGHTVKHVDVAELGFPLLRSQKEFETSPVPASLQPVRNEVLWAEHLVIFFPVWAGDMPALLKDFFEQVMRPAFAGKHASFFDKKIFLDEPPALW